MALPRLIRVAALHFPKLTTRKYLGMTKASRSTAWREIDDLLQKGLLRPLPDGGRSTAYTVFDERPE